MNPALLTYLIESSVYLLFFLVIYRLAISHQTHFTWMRVYLLLSLLLSLVLPFMVLSNQLTAKIMGQSLALGSFSINGLNPLSEMTTSSNSPTLQLSGHSNLWNFFLLSITYIYLLGALYKSILLFGNVNKIMKMIKKNVKIKEGAFWFVNTDTELPAFSFFHFIFINPKYKNFSAFDLLKIKDHEIVHAKQFHTLDILIVELIAIVFWFSPLVIYTKNRLQEIHEFLADEKTAGHGEMKKSYAQLLFNLATDSKTLNLMTGFSGKQISKRIVMVSKRRSIGWSKLLVISIFPMAFILLMAFSNFHQSINQSTIHQINNISSISNPLKVRDVKWVNNSVISSSELDKVLGLKKGDKYNEGNESSDRKILTDRISTFYLDKGYVFFNAEISSTPVNKDEVDLTITLYEGNRAKIGTVKVTGNKTVTSDEILSKITIQPGDLFSKTKIIESVRALSRFQQLDPEKIRPEVIPEVNKTSMNEFYTVNIVFDVTEK